MGTGRPLRLAGAFVALTALLPACPGGSPNASTSPSATPPTATASAPTPAAGAAELARALERTHAAGSARFDVDFALARHAGTARTVGAGSYDFRRGRGELRFGALSLGASPIEMRLFGPTVYWRAAFAGGRWARTDPASFRLPFGDVGGTDPLAVLDVVFRSSAVTAVRTEPHGGRRLVLDVDLPDVARGLGRHGGGLRAVLRILSIERRRAHVSLDAGGRIARFAFVLAFVFFDERYRMAFSLSFRDFGVAVDVERPRGRIPELPPFGAE